MANDTSDNGASPASPVAVVTGGGTGIGAATAIRLHEAGYRVVCAGRRLERVTQVARRLGDGAHAAVLDVTDPDSVGFFLARLPEGWREVEVLVNNAGHDAGGRRRFDEGTIDEWARIIDTNVTGLVRITHALIGPMLERGRGDVVNLGSVSGFEPYATGTLYAGSKHAVHGFSESLRRDYAGTGIRVIEILPGLVRTEFALSRWDDEERARSFYDEAAGTLDSDDIARSIAFALAQPRDVVLSQIVVRPAATA